MIKIDQKAVSQKESISVDFFYNSTKDNFKIKLFSDRSGFDKKIIDQNLHRPGLALAGFVELFSYSRIQVFGNTEMHYLAQLSDKQKVVTLERFFKFDIPCIVLADKNHPFPILRDLANKHNVAIFGSQYPTTKTIYFLSDFLDDQFAQRISIHGSFVDD